VIQREEALLTIVFFLDDLDVARIILDMVGGNGMDHARDIAPGKDDDHDGKGYSPDGYYGAQPVAKQVLEGKSD
jgi:hypothetical protein